MKNWLVVANAAKARVLEETSEPGVYNTVADLVHPQSRQKGSAQGHDRPGHVPGPEAHGTGSAALDPHLTPAEREHERFASELAALLNEAVAGGRCTGLLLVASNPFLGHVKAHLSDATQRALLRSMAADYTALSERELTDRVGAVFGAY